MIELRHVSIVSGLFCLRDLSLHLEPGEYVALMGRTGQGKSTILEAIAGLRAVTAGQIFIAGKDVTEQPPALRGVGYVPQDLALFPTMTVRENLEFALRIRRSLNAKRIEELAEWLGIATLLDRPVTQLSGGEAQRTALGRALSFEPKVLLLDEPFSALDEGTREEMHRLMKSVREKTGVTVLHVTHSRSEAVALADRVLTVEDGVLG
ncbi:MAG: cysA 2 [Verrucomicrobiaceae bacterium]|nr:cysA 2 [Verrucomicrobiaceae bacterium]